MAEGQPSLSIEPVVWSERQDEKCSVPPFTEDSKIAYVPAGIFESPSGTVNAVAVEKPFDNSNGNISSDKNNNSGCSNNDTDNVGVNVIPVVAKTEWNSSNGNNQSNYYNNNNNYNSGANRDYQSNNALVDSALLAAMRDSRERVALLRLEQVMIDFMNISDGYLEVGGPFNSVVLSPSKRNGLTQDVHGGGRQTSFQRCLLHRLADRFGILREAGTLMEGSIRLVKQKDSRVPKKLLLDHIDGEGKVVGVENGGSPDDNKESATSSSQNKANPKRKMRIMKRLSNAENGRGNANSNSNTPKARKNKNFSEKEKAYAEARARIFSDEGNNGNNISSRSISSEHPNTYNSQTLNPSSANVPQPRAHSHSNMAGDPVAHVTKVLSLSSLQAEERQQDDSTSGRVPVAATATNVSKATWRNRRQEESDPDFQRGGGLQMMGPPTNQVPAPASYGVILDGRNAVAGNTYFYPSPQQFQQQYFATAPTTSPSFSPSGAAQDEAYYNSHTSQQQPSQHPCYPSGAVQGRVSGGRIPFTARGFPTGSRHNFNNYNYRPNNNRDVSDADCVEEFPALR